MFDFDPRDYDSRDGDRHGSTPNRGNRGASDDRDRDGDCRQPEMSRDRDHDARTLGRGPGSRESSHSDNDARDRREDARSPERGRDCRERDVDPRDVFTRHLDLPRGPEREIVRERDREYNRARLYHVHSKALYHVVGDAGSRYRRLVSPRLAIERLMLLDAVLTTPDVEWITTAVEKAAYLARLTASASAATSQTSSPEDDSTHVVALPGALPIGVESDGRTVHRTRGSLTSGQGYSTRRDSRRCTSNG